VLVLLMGAIYEVRRWDGFTWHDIHTKFREDLFRLSKLTGGDTHTHRQQGDLIILLLFFQNKEIRKNIRLDVRTGAQNLGCRPFISADNTRW
jgi:hypothetical protein